MTAYRTLEQKFRRIADVTGAIAMLEWDSAVMMPAGSGAIRSAQVETLTVIAHEGLIDPALPDLAQAAKAETLDAWQQQNLRLMERQIAEATVTPGDLVAAVAKASVETELAWRAARANNDYKSILPQFSTLLQLTRESAKIRGAHFGLTSYDALLDVRQPGLRLSYFAPIFADLESFLPGFIDQVIAHQAALPQRKPVPTALAVETQKSLCEGLVKQAGFDMNQGRLDTSTHPFSGGVPGDIRMTTRYDEADFVSSIMGALHETGHSLYAMNLPSEWRGQPVGNDGGMMIHESQSLIMEMQAAHTREFISFLSRTVAAATGSDCDPDDLYRQTTKIERSFIRVDADEVTYPLHVVLRTKLEQALLSGDLALADLPAAWNDGMQNLLGITPPSDALGCLQDIHWYAGAFGYFPTYTLGAMLAAQLFQTATRADSGIYSALEQGSFAPLQSWLKTNVHSKASSIDAPTLITEATGKPLDSAVFKAHLRQRYLDS